MLEPLLSVDGLVSLMTLAMLEVILGIDNVIFISIISDRVNKEEQNRARILGLLLALGVRIVLLIFMSYLAHLKTDVAVLFGHHFTLRDLVLIAGGVFLVYKSTNEIHEKLEGDEEEKQSSKKLALWNAIVQIILIDIVFSFDSILTAIGLTDHVIIMVIAMVAAMVVMIVFSKAISAFINEHPTVKMLALSFLIMIGVFLIIEAFHYEIPKGYIYFSMFFSLLVEVLNLMVKKRSRAKKLKNKI
ncbi:MAG: terC [Cytophagaceae bacterium]|jgi:predicted tellurium resistance membrane protein TerC|nr:terC [Cytophagaceae bacterium]